MNATFKPTLVIQTFYISTGEKDAMYTLRMRRDSAGMNPDWMPDHYLCNLAATPEKAEAKATDYVERFKQRTGYTGPRETFVINFEPWADFEIRKRRGKLSADDTEKLEMIEAGIFPFGKHASTRIEDAPEGYVLYWADQLRKEDELSPIAAALAYVCMGHAMELGYVAARDEKREIQHKVDLSSNHIGEIKSRMTFLGKLELLIEKTDDWTGERYYINKVRQGDDLITYIGSKKLGERGQTIHFKATVKRHDVYNEVKSTVVNRPVLL
jgi:hypothetical protein